MRCSCHVCDTYMVHSEGPALGCVCPECGYRCRACLGTDSVVRREDLSALQFDTGLMAEIFRDISEDDGGVPVDDSPDKWGDAQWED